MYTHLELLTHQNMTWILNCVLGQVENLMRKGENTGYQHFLLSPQGVQRVF